MPVTPEELEAAVRAAMQVMHMEVQDNSSSCGDNYSVLIVSKVRTILFRLQIIINGLIIYRRSSKGRRRSLGTRWVTIQSHLFLPSFQSF